MASGVGIELSGRQRALLEWLTRLDASLVQMYLGVHAALRATGNPDHRPQACHAARELMEKLPRVTTPRPPGDDLKRRASDLDTALREYQERTGGDSTSLLGKPIDEDLMVVLRALETFVEWFRTNVPTAEVEAWTVLRLLEQSGGVLPEHLTRPSARRWVKLREWFVNSAHHRRTLTIDSVTAKVAELEGFLLERQVPDTFGDFAELDRLIGGGGE